MLFVSTRGIDVVGEVFEKVVLQYDGDAPEERGVDTFALKDVVDVLAIAIEFAGKPCHGALFLAQHCFYPVTDVDHCVMKTCGSRTARSPLLYIYI